MILATIASTVIGLLGKPIIDGVLNGYKAKLAAKTAKNKVFAEIMVANLEATSKIRQAAADERKHLMHPAIFTFLVFIIVFPAALYVGSIAFVSVFHTLGWTVEAAPQRFEAVYFQICMVFVGAGYGAQALMGFAAKFLK